MTLILNIETTTKACSVVLSKNNEVLSKAESFSEYTHAENLTSYISKVIDKASLTIDKLDAVAVSKGPGSYMGLRIGISTAKGLCYSLGIPLISVDTLQAMALKASKMYDEPDAVFCPMIDARRMEVYCAVFDNYNNSLSPVEAKIVEHDAFSSFLKNQVMYFFGDGAEKCKFLEEQTKNAKYMDYTMSADAIVELAYKKYVNNAFEDLAYFEPFYLKDFIPGISKVKGLR